MPSSVRLRRSTLSPPSLIVTFMHRTADKWLPDETGCVRVITAHSFAASILRRIGDAHLNELTVAGETGSSGYWHRATEHEHRRQWFRDVP